MQKVTLLTLGLLGLATAHQYVQWLEVPLLQIENNMFDFEVHHEFQIAAGTIYQGPVQRPPGTPANMGDLPANA